MAAIFLLLLAFVLFVIVAPVLVGIILLARKRTKVGAVVLSIYAILVVSFLLHAQISRRSISGHLVRWCMGAGLSKQEVDDQADELRRSSSLQQIQNWAVDTMRRFRSGHFNTNGQASYWSLGTVQLAHAEIPQLALIQWTASEPPEVSMRLSDSGDPECVVVAWYGKGVVFGATSYRLPLSEPNYQKEVTPGIYAYYLYK
jgi:hypothetical protein